LESNCRKKTIGNPTKVLAKGINPAGKPKQEKDHSKNRGCRHPGKVKLHAERKNPRILSLSPEEGLLRLVWEKKKYPEGSGGERPTLSYCKLQRKR